jgi:DNA-binding transcriptional MerR regulator
MALFRARRPEIGYAGLMEYTAAEIVEVTGVALRTIRLWSERRLLPPPLGRGPGTRYTEDHRVLICAIAKLRTETHQLKAIKKRIAKLSPAELLLLIGEKPAEQPERPAAQTGPAPQTTLPPQAPPPPLPGARDERSKENEAGERIETRARVGDAPLPDGQKWVIVGLLPQLALMVGEGASPLVRRVAAEICREYGER